MRFSFFLLVILGLGAMPPGKAQSPARRYPGEMARYKVKYSLYFHIPVGEFVFRVDTPRRRIQGRPLIHVHAVGYSYRFYDPFFMVRDTYGTFLDRQTGLPLVFYRKVHEGDYHFSEFVTFLRDKKVAYNRATRRTVRIPPMVHDMISAIFYARNIPYETLTPGDSITFPLYIDDSVYHVGIIYQGIETLRLHGRKVKTYKLSPILIVDRVFKSEEDMTIWVSTDDRRIPLRIYSGISVGAIEATLDEYRR